MNMLELLKFESGQTFTENGALAYSTTFNSNLDYFTFTTKNPNDSTLFINALNEDYKLALKNLMYKLDIRDGQGVRQIFKNDFKELIKISELNNHKYKKEIQTIIDNIPKLGRWDYILTTLYTNYEEYAVRLIYNQLIQDIKNYTENKNISLLAKWLPSHRIGHKNNSKAKRIIKVIQKTITPNYNEQIYRTTLSKLRSHIKIIEKTLQNKDDKIDFSIVPSKAHILYKNTFIRRYEDEYNEYLTELMSNKSKINSNNLFMDEIVKKIRKTSNNTEIKLLNQMWEHQDFKIKGMNHNILPVVDTSGSMEGNPLNAALALGILLSEKNKGIFKNHFITFSKQAKLVEIKGNTLYEKLQSFKPIVENTNINSVFNLILKTMIKYKLNSEYLPSHIIILSDMQFDECSTEITNFKHWKDEFKKHNFELPKIIFWKLTSHPVFPVTKDTNNVTIISGYSKNVFNNILNLEQFNPINNMINTLSKYDKIFKF